MNKKYLSALLFGAFTLVSTGTFTSCKDYDDDIEALQGQISKNAESIATIQALLNKGVVITSIQKNAQGIQLTTSDGKTYQLTNGKDGANGAAGLNGKDADVWTIGNDGYWYKNNSKTEWKALGETGATGEAGADGLDGADGGYYLPKSDGYFYYVTEDQPEGVKSDIKWTAGAMSAVKTNNYVIFSGIDGLPDGLKVATSLELKSLVFQPDFYYNGIEAMYAWGFNYDIKTVKKVDADGDYKSDKPSVGSAYSVIPGLVASYHINPSRAALPESLKDYKFLKDDKPYVRSNGAVLSINKTLVKGDTLTVTAKVAGADFKNIQKQSEVTVLALQVNNGDTLVTSDYAAVKAVEVTDLQLADVKYPIETCTQTAPQHLYKTAQDAIDNPASYEIMWNNDKGLDIATLVRTDYAKVDGTHSRLDVNAASAEVAKYGFEYTYELVGWHKGNNLTSESAHAALKGSLIRPQMTKDGKQQQFGYEQNKATKDKEPLVRIILRDKVNNKNIAVGYMKFKIVDKVVIPEVNDKVLLAVNFPFDKAYTVDCSTNSIALTLKWYQVSEQILAQLQKLGISKEQFHDGFEIDGGTIDATQYNGVEVSSVATTKVGVVSQTTWDPADTETEVLKWVVKNNEAYHALKANDGKITVNVRYSSVDKNNNVTTPAKYVYVSFTWTPSPMMITPNGAISDSDKIKQYWYAKNALTAGDGYSDIHGNVRQVISNNSADCIFQNEILNTMVGNKLSVSSDAKYPAFADNQLNKSVRFVKVQNHLTKVANNYTVLGASGQKYAITVSADQLTLLAAKVGTTTTYPVVVLQGAQNTLMVYQENDVAKDILNNADHKELGQDETFTAQLEFYAGKCDDIVPFELKNSVFFAKYLRPVSCNPSDVNELEDATNGASIAALALNLIDWRDKEFDNPAHTEGYDFYGFYGVQNVTADIANATTNLNDGNIDKTKLSAVTGNVKLYFGVDEFPGEPTISKYTALNVKDHGKFYYYNNGTTLGQFDVKVPLVVEYKWGKVHTHVTLHINKTNNN